MTPTRAVAILSAVLIVHALLYLVWLAVFEPIWGTPDLAGFVMLLALGLAMGFGGLVLVRGARDL